MDRRVLSVLLAVALGLAGEAFAGQAPARSETEGGRVEQQRLDVSVTADYFSVTFSEVPESRFFLHAADALVVMAQPGKSTISSSLDRVAYIAYDRDDSRMTVEWTTSQGRTLVAAFAGVDALVWAQLKDFIGGKVRVPIEIRE